MRRYSRPGSRMLFARTSAVIADRALHCRIAVPESPWSDGVDALRRLSKRDFRQLSGRLLKLPVNFDELEVNGREFKSIRRPQLAATFTSSGRVMSPAAQSGRSRSPCLR